MDKTAHVKSSATSHIKSYAGRVEMYKFKFIALHPAGLRIYLHSAPAGKKKLQSAVVIFQDFFL